jgi:WD40 repeat protein/serine/threonine protein kinase
MTKRKLDQIRDAFGAAWAEGNQPDLGEFLLQVDRGEADDLLGMLIHVDLSNRLKRGLPVDSKDYVRFGNHAFKLAEEELAGKSDSDGPELEATLDNVVNQTPGAIASITSSASRVIGPYKLLQKLGAGGMGEVWMAEQSRPVRRRVALKLIKAGAANKQIVARFEAERQALAMMRHENIAAVYDGGETEDGMPYFVMELVHGIPLTEYCDKVKLSIGERLTLFRKVCDAVQHAHQKGIIHRDLKPSNILVGQIDGMPVPKVIDFGLAKAIEQETNLTDKTMFTEFGQVMGTLQYMSPEQAEMNQFGVDTRTDIYSLGVILYELLTGSTPLDQASMHKQALMQILEMIKTKEPPRPSSRLSNSSDQVKGISQQRKIEPKRLQQILNGDLDWIVMKAIEKDRDRRYPTASSFADDIGRYVNNDAVEARPPSLSYRATKAVRKHKAAFIVGTTIACLLVAGLVGTGTMWFKASMAEGIAVAEANKARTAEAKARASERLEREANREVAAERDRAKIAEEEAVKARDDAMASERNTSATLARSNFFLANSRRDDGRFAEANVLLDRIPNEFRNFEWGLTRRQYLGNTVSFWGHTDSVRCVCMSPDGSRIASASLDHTIKLWNVASSDEIRTLIGHAGVVSSVSFSPDGTLFASASDDKTIKIWDAVTGTELHTLQGHTLPVNCVSFSPDGMSLASASNDGTVKLWNASSGEELRTLKGHDAFIYCVSFSPDGTRLASSSNAFTIKLWDAASGAELYTIYHNLMMDWADPKYTDTLNNFSKVRSVHFSPDGSRLASASNDGTIELWDAANGTKIRSLKSHSGGVNSVHYSPDGMRFASASDDNTIKVWETASGNELSTLRGHTGSVHSICFTPDGRRLVSSSDDKTIKLWDLVSGDEPRTLSGKTADVTRLGSLNSFLVSFSPDGTRLASTCNDYSIKLWDAASGAELCTLKGHSENAIELCFSPDGTQLASAGNDQTIKLWDAATGTELRTFQGHTATVRCLHFSADGTRLLSSSHDKTIKLWDTTSGSVLLTRQGFDGEPAWSVQFSPDGTRLVSAGRNYTIKLWDASNGAELHALKMHTGNVTSVTFSPDGTRVASASHDKTIKLWDVASGTELITLEGHSNHVQSASFSPDGTRIASASKDNTVKIWDAASGAELRTLEGHSGRIRNICFSPDGMRLACARDDETIELWDAPKKFEDRRFIEHTSNVTKVRFSNDGKQLLSEDKMGRQLVWTLSDGNPTESQPYQPIEESLFRSQDGKWLAIPEGNNIRVVDLEFKNTSAEKERRARVLGTEPSWHYEQAEQATKAGDWFAAAFHLAWYGKTHVSSDTGFSVVGILDQLKDSFAKLEQKENALLEPLVRDAIEVLKAAESEKLAEYERRVAIPAGHDDLLILIDPKKDWTSATWTRADGLLESANDQAARLQVGYQLPDEYRMTATVEPLDNPSTLLLGQRLVGNNFLVMLNYPVSGVLSGLQFVDGKDAAIVKGELFRQGQLSDVVVTVRKAGVQVSVDGKEIIHWQGDPASLTPSEYWSTPNKNAVMIGSYMCRYRYHRLSIEPLSGEGKALQ